VILAVLGVRPSCPAGLGQLHEPALRVGAAYFTKGLGLSAATASALRHQLLEGARADRYGAGSRTPGLQMPAGSRARLSALKASSSPAPVECQPRPLLARCLLGRDAPPELGHTGEDASSTAGSSGPMPVTFTCTLPSPRDRTASGA